MVYGMSMYVEQIWVYGNSFESSLVAVVVPNEESLRKWASVNGLKGTFADLCNDKTVQDFLLSDLTSVGRQQKVHAFTLVCFIFI